MNATTLLRTTTATLLLSTAIATAHAADTSPGSGGERVEQTGPSGMPATTGSGASAETKGTFSDSGDEMGVGVETFFDQASEYHLAAIEAAKMALEQGSPDVKAYAQAVLDKHQQIQSELESMATTMNTSTEDNPDLVAQASQWLIELRDDQAFDQAYLDNQIVARQQEIALYTRAAQIQHEQIVTFAEKTLPSLQAELEQAQTLAGREPSEPK